MTITTAYTNDLTDPDMGAARQAVPLAVARRLADRNVSNEERDRMRRFAELTARG